MTNMLDTASTWLAGQRDTHLADSVTYSRGDDSVIWTAARGRSEYEVNDSYGVGFVGHLYDFIGKSATLILSGSVIEPQAGDTITATTGAYTYTYEVTNPADSEPPFSYCDPHHTSVRVHTRFKSRV